MDDDFVQDMELDDAPNGSGQHTKSNPAGDLAYHQLVTEAIQYGQELQKDYRDDQEAQDALTRIFSLVAYDNPKDSTHGELLDKKGRSQVAEELNSAILGTQSSMVRNDLADTSQSPLAVLLTLL